MSKLSRVIFATAIAVGMSFCACADIVVDDELPAGNIVFEKIEGDTVSVHQDLRDTTEAWFYWGMRVTGAAGRTLTFKFTTSDAVGVRGPVVTTDCGQTYNYGGTSVTRKQFTYAFGATENETWFYECIPYMPSDWTAFLSQHEDKCDDWFETGVLCQSSKTSTDVPKARFGCISGTPKYKLLLSSRHHCSETVATYVLEGIAAAFLKDDDLGAWLRANVLCEAVPFVDYDGVVAGDQGKSRSPHDHNRDYTEFIYTETKALAALATNMQADVWFDIHCPWLYNAPNEYLYTPKKDPNLPYIHVDNESRFSQILQSNISNDGIPYSASHDIDYGTSWNTAANYSQGWSSIIWGLTYVSSSKLCRTFEVPFANADGTTVTQSRLRVLGNDIAKSLKDFFLAYEENGGNFGEAEPPPSGKDLTKLPDDYTEVEYVQSTCDQYVDTGYKPNAKTTIHFEFAVDKYDYRELTTSTSLKNDRNNAYVLACYNERCQFAYGSSSFMGFGTTYNNAVNLSKDTDSHCLGITNATFYIDGVSKYTGNTTFDQGSSQQPLYVFALNSSGTPKYLCAAKVYSLIISEDGVEKRHYIPAVYAEGKVGLYDTVTGGFHQSKSSPLVAGPTVGPVSDEPKFSGFNAEGSLSRVWEQVTVSDGAEYNATVEAYMGTDPANWTAISNWTHSVERATYAATNSEVTVGSTYYCAFKMTYERESETIVKWTSTNSVVITGDVHWRGKGADTKWSTAENWKEGLVPSPALTAKFDMGGTVVASAGDEELSARGVYVTQGTTIWDFQPETTLAMTYLHIGASDAKTAANLIVTNGVINATGSIAFDYSNGSFQLSGTKATYGVKLYQTKVGDTTLKLTDGASLKMPAYDSAGDASGGDTFFIGEGSSLLFTGGSDYSTPSTIPKNSTITIDGGAWTNYNKFSLATDANSVDRIIVKNGGVFSHRPNSHLSSSKKPLSLGGRGHTYITVIGGGVLDVLYDLYFGDSTDAYAGSSEIAITNGTFKCTGAMTIGRDSRCKANYKVTVAGEDGLLEAKGGLTLGSTSYAGGTERTGGSATLIVDGGTANITGALKVGADHERVTDTLKVLGSTAKVTATSIACTTNAVIKFVVPENGFANIPVVATNLVLASEAPTPIEIDATACTSGSWQTLMQAGGAISNLVESQVSVSVASGKNYELNLEKDGELTKALKLRIFSAAPRGTVIIYR